MLTIALVLHAATSGPYQRTKAATAGPDIVATLTSGADGQAPNPSGLAGLMTADGVTGHSGPYPLSWTTLRSGGYTATAELEGRGSAQAAVDRPSIASGSWIRPGSVDVEQSFAAALHLRVGDRISVAGHRFAVAGIAVSAGIPAYPSVCSIGCVIPSDLPNGQPGLVWMTTQDLVSVLAGKAPSAWYLNLRIHSPSEAAGYAAAYDATHPDPGAPVLWPWQHIAAADNRIVSTERDVLLVGSWLLGLLAVAGVAVLAGGRMAAQLRRVGLLKAVGAGPGLVTVALIAENVLVAVLAGAAGLGGGRLVAPLFSGPGAGLLGAVPAPSITGATAGTVLAGATGTALVATLIPAWRGARTSTIAALAGTGYQPRRRPLLTRASSHLPTTLLLGTRIASRRPRRTLLAAASMTVTVAGVVAVLMVRARYSARFAGPGDAPNPLLDRVGQVMAALTVALVVLSVVNLVLITAGTMIDFRRPSALARALGLTPGRVSAALAIAQLLPGTVAGIVGVPAGIAMYTAVKRGAATAHPPLGSLALVVVVTPLAAGALSLASSLLSTRRTITDALQADTA